jgi:hypothetical protein
MALISSMNWRPVYLFFSEIGQSVIRLGLKHEEIIELGNNRCGGNFLHPCFLETCK